MRPLRFVIILAATLGQAATAHPAAAGDTRLVRFEHVQAAALSGSVQEMKRLLKKRYPVGAFLEGPHRSTKQYVDYRLETDDGFALLVRFPSGEAIPSKNLNDDLELVDFEPYTVDRRLRWYPVFSLAPGQ